MFLNQNPSNQKYYFDFERYYYQYNGTNSFGILSQRGESGTKFRKFYAFIMLYLIIRNNSPY